MPIPLLRSALQGVASTARALARPLRRVLPVGGDDPDDPDKSSGRDRWEPQPEEVRAKVRVQVEVLRRALGSELAVCSETGDDADALFLHHRSRLLVRTRDVERVAATFKRDERYDGSGEWSTTRCPGLSVYHPPPRRDGDVDPLVAVSDLERRLGPGVATPDHLLVVMPRGMGSVCPAIEPELPPDSVPLPPPSPDRAAGKGVRVSVVDTGWWPDAARHDWLAADVAGDVEVVDADAIHEYAGHGTFVAGVVRCMAPATTIEVEGFLTRGGAVWESEIVEELQEAVTDPDGPDLISISAGGRTRHGAPMLSFLVLRDVARAGLRARKGRPAYIVAAAGNDGADWPLYPAAFDWVLSVGSLDADGSVSDFSNFGDWVDVYARGRDLVNAFPVGTYTCYEPEHRGEVRVFDGLAQWSGTSFSTPVVTGTIAALMSRGLPVDAAVAQLIADGTPMTAPDGSAAFRVADF
jgi:hypothetical protein